MPQPPGDSHPPRPQLTIRVGLTGHRWDKLRFADLGNLRRRLDEVFTEIERIAVKVSSAPGYAASSRIPGTIRLRLLTGLAEGADRLGAEVALGRPGPWELQAMLPYAEADYRLSFGPGKSTQPKEFEATSDQHFSRLLEAARASGGVQVLAGAKADLAAPYLPLGIALALNSDVLVAVWDNQRGEGPGGTEYNINLANSYGIPIVHILAVGTAPPVVYLPVPNGVARVARLEEALGPRLESLLLPPSAPRLHPTGRERPDLREAYFEESARVVPHVVEAVKQSWRKRWVSAGVSEALISSILATPLALHYAWASHLAGRHAARYRDGYKKVYALAPFAVFASASGLVLGHNHQEGLAIGFAVLEVVLLGWVAFTVFRHRRKAVHDRWLDYRSLAERIRLLPMVLPLGRSPVLRVREGDEAGAPDTWVDWLFRAIVREAGVLPVDLAAQSGSAKALVLRSEIPDQIAYHHRTAEKHDRTERRLRRLRDWSFVFGALLAVANLALLLLDEGNGPHLPSWLNFPEWFKGAAAMRAQIPAWLEGAAEVLALTLPAVGAATQGYRSQGEFEDTARRSQRVKEELETVQHQAGSASVGASLDELGAITSDVVGIMASEQSAWFEAYEMKIPENP